MPQNSIINALMSKMAGGVGAPGAGLGAAGGAGAHGAGPGVAGADTPEKDAQDVAANPKVAADMNNSLQSLIAGMSDLMAQAKKTDVYDDSESMDAMGQAMDAMQAISDKWSATAQGGGGLNG